MVLSVNPVGALCGYMTRDLKTWSYPHTAHHTGHVITSIAQHWQQCTEEDMHQRLEGLGIPHKKQRRRRTIGLSGMPRLWTCPPSSASTIGRQLEDAGLHARRPVWWLPLMPSQLHQGLQWCHTRLPWSDSEWQWVIFSDEFCSCNLCVEAPSAPTWKVCCQASHV